MAARGAPDLLQGALAAVPYAIIAALATVLFRMDVNLCVAAVNVDLAFDALLPTPRQMTMAPIMLPARLPEELSNVAIDSATGGDEYGILFLAQPTDDIVKDYVHAYDKGTIRSTSDPREVSAGPGGGSPYGPERKR